MKELKQQINLSGLKQSWIAAQVGISGPHLTMMLNGKAKMGDVVRKKIEKLLEK